MSTTERPSGRRQGRIATVVIGALLALGAFGVAFPFIWMVFASVKPRSESVAYPPQLLPQQPTFEFFQQLFVELDFGRYLVNTLAIVLISMVGLVLMAACGYGFAKFVFPGRDALFFLVLVTMMIPVRSR
jgi:multiple sugar transport system permease protein